MNIKFVGLDIKKNLNVAKGNRELDMAAGKLKRIVKAGRNTLLVEASSQKQVEKLSRVIAVAGHQVEVETHRTLNRVKGVGRSWLMGQSTEAEILECLDDEQSVTDISRGTIIEK